MLLISKVVHLNKQILLLFGIKQDNVGPDGMYQMTEKNIFTMASHVSSALVSTILLSPLFSLSNPSILVFANISTSWNKYDTNDGRVIFFCSVLRMEIF